MSPKIMPARNATTLRIIGFARTAISVFQKIMPVKNATTPKTIGTAISAIGIRLKITPAKNVEAKDDYSLWSLIKFIYYNAAASQKSKKNPKQINIATQEYST